MKILIRSVLLILILALMLPLSVVSAVIPPAQTFYGSVTLDGSPAPDGTSVTAFMNGTQRGGDSVSGGTYSLIVQTIDGDNGGDAITFFVDGYSAGGTTLTPGDITPFDLSATSPPGEYTLTINTGGDGSGSTSGAGDYTEGTIVNISATPAHGSEFVNWTGATVGDSGASSTTILMDADKTITANFNLLPEYSLTLTTDGNGSANASPGPPYYQGDSVQINATANEGYKFAFWSGDTVYVDNVNNPTASVTMNGDYNITANFIEAEIFTLTMNVNGSGSTTPPVGEHQYEEGQVVPITATPNAGWEFVNWTGGVADPDSASTTVTMDGNKTISASFSQLPVYTLTIEVNGSGSTTPAAGSYPYPEGSVVDLIATPDEGWLFNGWTGDVANPDSASTTVTMDGDKTISASFIEEEAVVYTLTINVNGNGSTSPTAGKHQYEEGEVVLISATADEGWQFDGWSGDVVNPNSASTSVIMDGDKTISASFSDATAPVVSGVSAVGASRTAVDIIWITDEPGDSQVEYRSSPAQLSPLDSTLVTGHSIRLTELTAATTYFFKVMSRDVNGNLTVSEEYSFTTAATEATFSTANWNTSLDNVEGGTQLTVSFTVINNGDLAGNYMAKLNVNGNVADSEEVSLEAGTSREITLSTTQSAVDTYTVSLDGFTLSFAVAAAGGGGIGLLPVIGIIAGLLLLVAAIIIYLKRDQFKQKFARREVFAGTAESILYPGGEPQVEESAAISRERTLPPFKEEAEFRQEETKEEETQEEVEEESGGLIITALAMLKLREALQAKTLDPEVGFRIILSSSKPSQLKMILDRIKEGDKVVESEGVKILFISPELIPMLEEMFIDYQETPQGGGFTISRPTAD